MHTYSKHIKKLIREYSMKAHERELHRELTKLDQSFEEWRQGKIGSGELTDRIHTYHNGPARLLYGKYNSGDPEMNVALAILDGILEQNELPREVLDALQDQLARWKQFRGGLGTEPLEE